MKTHAFIGLWMKYATAGVAHEIGPDFEPSSKPCLFFFEAASQLWRGAAVPLAGELRIS